MLSQSQDIMPLSYFHRGEVIQLRILKNAKKNIILRVVHSGCLKISIPKTLSNKALFHWLNTNEALIERLFNQHRFAEQSATTLPEKIWFRGVQHSVQTAPLSELIHKNRVFYLPPSPSQQKHLLRQYFYQEAQTILLNKLKEHAQNMRLQPKKSTLSNAKTFWGVCRSKTGIKLNWRLIGAPDEVIDYVCIHELVHLIYPNHSRDFWAKVAQHTPHIDKAKMWLKKYGNALFLLD